MTATEAEEYARNYARNNEEAKAAAEATGQFDVILGDDYTLLLDLDSASDKARWDKCKDRLKEFDILVRSIETWFSKSGNFHVKIEMEAPLSVRERAGLEAILGSDRYRAGHIYEQAYTTKYPCMLFKPRNTRPLEINHPPPPLAAIDLFDIQ